MLLCVDLIIKERKKSNYKNVWNVLSNIIDMKDRRNNQHKRHERQVDTIARNNKVHTVKSRTKPDGEVFFKEFATTFKIWIKECKYSGTTSNDLRFNPRLYIKAGWQQSRGRIVDWNTTYGINPFTRTCRGLMQTI